MIILFKLLNKDVQKLFYKNFDIHTFWNNKKRISISLWLNKKTLSFTFSYIYRKKNLIFYLSFIKFSSHVWNFSYQTFIQRKYKKNLYVILFYLTLNQNIHLFRHAKTSKKKNVRIHSWKKNEKKTVWILNWATF